MQTGFALHVGCALIAAVLIGWFCYSFLNFPLDSIALPLILFVFSAAVPDLDCASSRPRKYLRFGVFFTLCVLAIVYYSPLAGIHMALPFALPLAGVLLVELLLPGHRALLHSPLAAIAWGALFFFPLNSAFAGLMAGLGYASHLIIDRMGDST